MPEQGLTLWDVRGCRRFFRSTLQPIAEHLEYNPVAVAARYRGNYLGSVSLPTQQTSSYSAAPVDKPKREGGTPDELPGQALDPNREPPEGSLDKQGGGTPAKVCTSNLDGKLSGPRSPAFCRVHSLVHLGLNKIEQPHSVLDGALSVGQVCGAAKGVLQSLHLECCADKRCCPVL